METATWDSMPPSGCATAEINGRMTYRLIHATVGRLIFNEAHSPGSGLCGPLRAGPGVRPGGGFPGGQEAAGRIIDRCIRKHGFTIATEMLDRVKALGYKYSTKGAISVSIADMNIPQAKYTLIKQAEQQVVKIDQYFKRGYITNDERYRLVVEQWEQTTKEVTDALQGNLDQYNTIYMMADSGARGSMNQIRQLAGMRGLMADTSGRTIEIPVKANFREGLSVLEYFISSRGARKGLTDTALRTADSGYLTRRLVDVSQDMIVRIHDCGTTHGIWVGEVVEKGHVIDTFGNRIRGRYPVHDVVDPKTGELLHPKNKLMMPEDAALFEAHGIHKIYIRTPLGCQARKRPVRRVLRHEPGHLRGGQSGRGRRHHRGPVHRRARYPADHADLPLRRHCRRRHHPGSSPSRGAFRGPPAQEDGADCGGLRHRLHRRNPPHRPCVPSPSQQTTARSKPIRSPYSIGLKIENGKPVEKGQPSPTAPCIPQDILRISGVEAVQDYLVQSVQAVYRQQGRGHQRQAH